MNPTLARILFLLVTMVGLLWTYVGVPYFKLGDEWTTSRLNWNFFRDRPFAAFIWGAFVMEVVRDGWIDKDVSWLWFFVLMVGLGGLGHMLWCMSPD